MISKCKKFTIREILQMQERHRLLNRLPYNLIVTTEKIRTCAAEMEVLELALGQRVLVEALPDVAEVDVPQDHVLEVEAQRRYPGDRVEVLLAVLSHATRGPMTDLFEKVHVGVEANAQGEDGHLLAPVGFVDGLHDLLLDQLVAAAGSAVRDQDDG